LNAEAPGSEQEQDLQQGCVHEEGIEEEEMSAEAPGMKELELQLPPEGSRNGPLQVGVGVVCECGWLGFAWVGRHAGVCAGVGAHPYLFQLHINLHTLCLPFVGRRPK
jgi:hypothetical protein